MLAVLSLRLLHMLRYLCVHKVDELNIVANVAFLSIRNESAIRARLVQGACATFARRYKMYKAQLRVIRKHADTVLELASERRNI